jgi:hypothetical protein
MDILAILERDPGQQREAIVFRKEFALDLLLPFAFDPASAYRSQEKLCSISAIKEGSSYGGPTAEESSHSFFDAGSGFGPSRPRQSTAVESVIGGLAAAPASDRRGS